jgi:hypothetical protein
VFVASGAKVTHSLIMSNTYVGGQVTLENSVAQGNSVQSVKWDVRTVLRDSDALLTALKGHSRRSTPVLSRLLAVAAFALLVPALPALAFCQWLQSRRILWQRVPVVGAKNPDRDQLDLLELRLPIEDQPIHRASAYFGALLDIMQGRRNWFGIRPRNESDWHALGRDWQDLFSGRAIGLFYAPAWKENSLSLSHEAYAVADAFMTVQGTATGRLKILYSVVLGGIRSLLGKT